MKKYVCFVLAVLVLSLQCIGLTAHADGDTVLTTTVPETFSIKVTIVGGGYILFDGSRYYNGDIIRVPGNTSVDFSLVPAPGLRPYSVKFNNQTLWKNRIGTYTTPPVNSVSTLSVKFSSSIIPATGDNNSISLFTFCCITSPLLFATVFKTYRKLYKKD